MIMLEAMGRHYLTVPPITRRGFLQSAALAAAWAALVACTSTPPNGSLVLGSRNGATPLPSNRMPGSHAELHLLRRISFGPNPGDIERVRPLGQAAHPRGN